MPKNTKFDLDLEYGQIREKRIEKLLKESKIEIKTERSVLSAVMIEFAIPAICPSGSRARALKFPNSIPIQKSVGPR